MKLKLNCTDEETTNIYATHRNDANSCQVLCLQTHGVCKRAEKNHTSNVIGLYEHDEQIGIR